MITIQDGAGDGASRRAHIEAMLADYPDVSKEQLDELLAWFNREASSLDVGMVASNEAISRGYRLFRAEHIDRFRARDLGYAALFVTMVCGVVAMIAYLAG